MLEGHGLGWVWDLKQGLIEAHGGLEIGDAN